MNFGLVCVGGGFSYPPSGFGVTFFNFYRYLLSIGDHQRLQKCSKMKKAPEPLVPEKVALVNTFKEPSKHHKIFKDTPSPECENPNGLATLLDELLLGIISYDPESNLDLNEGYSKTEANAHFSRRERLVALSQRCRNIRRFLHPYVTANRGVCHSVIRFDPKALTISDGEARSQWGIRILLFICQSIG